MNITFPEWGQKCQELAAQAAKRVPACEIKGDKDGILVECREVSGALFLRTKAKCAYMVSEAHVTASPSLCGTLSGVEAGVFDFRQVLDVLHFLAIETNRLRVWNQKDGQRQKLRQVRRKR